ncbi:MAG: formate dehydrogenase accessory sulfurtransferase FdhD [Halanaerobiales bacterium]|nr:formate dehydrogenase accessory sulfurtransferase FdhD [Halanaerobiales bacterium]
MMNNDNNLQDVDIKKVKMGNIDHKKDQVIKEVPLTIFVNNKELLTLMTIPREQKELTIGFLISESIIESIDQIEDLILSKENTIVNVTLNKNIEPDLFKKRTLTSGCGKGITFTKLKDCDHFHLESKKPVVKPDKILKLIKKLESSSILFKKTGGTHTAALADKKDLIFVVEDIGRHNTIDKIIGKSYLNNINLKDKLLLTSGRISSEIIIKALRQSIPIIISRSAPSSAAVKIGIQKNMTLIGFTRGKRFNIYSDNNRISL